MNKHVSNISKWVSGKQILALCKWCPGLNPEVALSVATLTWIRLLVLPLEFWDDEIFIAIANSFRHFLALDSVIENWSIFVFARLCTSMWKLLDLGQTTERGVNQLYKTFLPIKHLTPHL